MRDKYILMNKKKKSVSKVKKKKGDALKPRKGKGGPKAKKKKLLIKVKKAAKPKLKKKAGARKRMVNKTKAKPRPRKAKIRPKPRKAKARPKAGKAPKGRKIVKKKAAKRHKVKKMPAKVKRMAEKKKKPVRKAQAVPHPAATPKAAPAEEGEAKILGDVEKGGEASEFNVKVQNIVAFTNLGKPISLEKMLKNVENTEWQPEQFPGLVYKIKYPRASALIFSQGKIVCTGTKSLEELKIAMKKIVERIRQAGIEMPKTYDIKVENIVASTKIKADLHLDEIALMLENSEYEPEQFPGLVYRISEPRVAFLLFTSGRIICAGAQNVESIHRALKKFKENLEAHGIKVEPVREE
jgi:transcription initiation factor TFIID TATA-box-binding protein